jgi:hypothetical protein
MASQIRDSERYRGEAARCRNEARQAVLPETRRRLEDIADTYLRLARQAEKLLEGGGRNLQDRPWPERRPDARRSRH